MKLCHAHFTALMAALDERKLGGMIQVKTVSDDEGVMTEPLSGQRITRAALIENTINNFDPLLCAFGSLQSYCLSSYGMLCAWQACALCYVQTEHDKHCEKRKRHETCDFHVDHAIAGAAKETLQAYELIMKQDAKRGAQTH